MIWAASLSVAAQASVTFVQDATAWFESGYVTWRMVEGAKDYAVYIAPAEADEWTQLDKELVRAYPEGYRADALGLMAGDYRFKVVPASSAITK